MQTLYHNPWTGDQNSPVDYSKPVMEIVANACTHAVHYILGKLHVSDQDIISDTVAAAYSRVIRTFRSWDTHYPFHDFCWNCARQVYPSILDRHNRTRTDRLDSYDDISAGIPLYKGTRELSEKEEVEDLIAEARSEGIEPAFGTYEEYRRHYAAEAIRRMASRRPGTVRSHSGG